MAPSRLIGWAAAASLLFLSHSAHSQPLPARWEFSADGTRMRAGNATTSGWYDPGLIRTVSLTFAQPDWWTQLTNNYASETLIRADMSVDGTAIGAVGVRFRGNTSYTQIASSQKKSFAIDLGFIDPELELMGYNDLKFNNAHQDPTFMREVLFHRVAARHIPQPRAGYVLLMLNGQAWGLYTNIQDTDKRYLKEWFLSNDGARFRATRSGSGSPGWGDGTAGMNYLGPDTTLFQQYYTLGSSDIPEPWSRLVDATRTLSQITAATVGSADQVLDIDRALWFLAVENIFTDDDSYVMKGKMDYMVHVEAETGRTAPLEYDGNSTFMVNNATSTAWGPFKNATNANYPLLYKLLNIPELRQRYLAHYRTILTESFHPDTLGPMIDALNTQIAGHVANDPKKLYTTTAYINGVPALKNFVSTRRTWLLSNAEVAQVAPAIASVNRTGRVVTASVSHAQGLNRVTLYWSTGRVGAFTRIEMTSQGGTQWSATLPAQTSGTLIRYYVEAVANSAARSASYSPRGAEHDVYVYTTLPDADLSGVVINEVMASNTLGIRDEAGDLEDWIELRNNGAIDVDVSGWFLSDNPERPDKWTFPAGTMVPANGYLLIWADEEAAEGPLHANFKLSKDGESVVLSTAQGTLVDRTDFGAQTSDLSWARFPDGLGDFAISTPTPRAANSGTSGSGSGGNGNGSGSDRLVSVSETGIRHELRLRIDPSLWGEPVEVHTLLGQRVMRFEAQAAHTVSLRGYSSGVYLIRVGGETLRFVNW